MGPPRECEWSCSPPSRAFRAFAVCPAPRSPCSALATPPVQSVARAPGLAASSARTGARISAWQAALCRALRCSLLDERFALVGVIADGACVRRRVVQSSAVQAPCPRAPGPRCLAAASAARGMICRLPSLLASGRPPERAAPRARRRARRPAADEALLVCATQCATLPRCVSRGSGDGDDEPRAVSARLEFKRSPPGRFHCMCFDINARARAHIYRYKLSYVYIYTCIYTHMYLFMYAYTHARRSTHSPNSACN